MFSLKGKRACVTGGASGIGLAVSKVFARQGAEVHILELHREAGEAAAEGICSEYGPNCAHAHACDVSDESSVSNTFAALDTLGGVDILCNNAGIASIGSVLDTTVEEMQRVYNVNVKGGFLCTKHAVKSMLSHGRGGAIVNLASIASVIGIADRFAYSMTKGAVLTMTLSTATDFVKKGIRCNCVCPARIHTPFVDKYLRNSYPGQEKAMFEKLSEYQPIGRMGKPAEIAALILYLVSDEAAFVTGAAYHIDGGVIARM